MNVTKSNDGFIINLGSNVIKVTQDKKINLTALAASLGITIENAYNIPLEDAIRIVADYPGLRDIIAHVDSATNGTPTADVSSDTDAITQSLYATLNTDDVEDPVESLREDNAELTKKNIDLNIQIIRNEVAAAETPPDIIDALSQPTNTLEETRFMYVSTIDYIRRTYPGKYLNLIAAVQSMINNLDVSKQHIMDAQDDSVHAFLEGVNDTIHEFHAELRDQRIAAENERLEDQRMKIRNLDISTEDDILNSPYNIYKSREEMCNNNTYPYLLDTNEHIQSPFIIGVNPDENTFDSVAYFEVVDANPPDAVVQIDGNDHRVPPIEDEDSLDNFKYIYDIFAGIFRMFRLSIANRKDAYTINVNNLPAFENVANTLVDGFVHNNSIHSQIFGFIPAPMSRYDDFDDNLPHNFRNFYVGAGSTEHISQRIIPYFKHACIQTKTVAADPPEPMPSFKYVQVMDDARDCKTEHIYTPKVTNPHVTAINYGPFKRNFLKLKGINSNHWIYKSDEMENTLDGTFFMNIEMKKLVLETLISDLEIINLAGDAPDYKLADPDLRTDYTPVGRMFGDAVGRVPFTNGYNAYLNEIYKTVELSEAVLNSPILDNDNFHALTHKLYKEGILNAIDDRMRIYKNTCMSYTCLVVIEGLFVYIADNISVDSFKDGSQARDMAIYKLTRFLLRLLRNINHPDCLRDPETFHAINRYASEPGSEEGPDPVLFEAGETLYTYMYKYLSICKLCDLEARINVRRFNKVLKHTLRDLVDQTTGNFPFDVIVEYLASDAPDNKYFSSEYLTVLNEYLTRVLNLVATPMPNPPELAEMVHGDEPVVAGPADHGLRSGLFNYNIIINAVVGELNAIVEEITNEFNDQMNKLERLYATCENDLFDIDHDTMDISIKPDPAVHDDMEWKAKVDALVYTGGIINNNEFVHNVDTTLLTELIDTNMTNIWKELGVCETYVNSYHDLFMTSIQHLHDHISTDGFKVNFVNHYNQNDYDEPNIVQYARELYDHVNVLSEFEHNLKMILRFFVKPRLIHPLYYDKQHSIRKPRARFADEPRILMFESTEDNPVGITNQYLSNVTDDILDKRYIAIDENINPVYKAMSKFNDQLKRYMDINDVTGLTVDDADDVMSAGPGILYDDHDGAYTQYAGRYDERRNLILPDITDDRDGVDNFGIERLPNVPDDGEDHSWPMPDSGPIKHPDNPNPIADPIMVMVDDEDEDAGLEVGRAVYRMLNWPKNKNDVSAYDHGGTVGEEVMSNVGGEYVKQYLGSQCEHGEPNRGNLSELLTDEDIRARIKCYSNNYTEYFGLEIDMMLQYLEEVCSGIHLAPNVTFKNIEYTDDNADTVINDNARAPINIKVPMHTLYTKIDKDHAITVDEYATHITRFRNTVVDHARLYITYFRSSNYLGSCKYFRCLNILYRQGYYIMQNIMQMTFAFIEIYRALHSDIIFQTIRDIQAYIAAVAPLYRPVVSGVHDLRAWMDDVVSQVLVNEYTFRYRNFYLRSVYNLYHMVHRAHLTEHLADYYRKSMNMLGKATKGIMMIKEFERFMYGAGVNNLVPRDMTPEVTRNMLRHLTILSVMSAAYMELTNAKLIHTENTTMEANGVCPINDSIMYKSYDLFINDNNPKDYFNSPAFKQLGCTLRQRLSNYKPKGEENGVRSYLTIPKFKHKNQAEVRAALEHAEGIRKFNRPFGAFLPYNPEYDTDNNYFTNVYIQAITAASATHPFADVPGRPRYQIPVAAVSADGQSFDNYNVLDINAGLRVGSFLYPYSVTYERYQNVDFSWCTLPKLIPIRLLEVVAMSRCRRLSEYTHDKLIAVYKEYIDALNFISDNHENIARITKGVLQGWHYIKEAMYTIQAAFTGESNIPHQSSMSEVYDENYNYDERAAYKHEYKYFIPKNGAIDPNVYPTLIDPNTHEVNIPDHVDPVEQCTRDTMPVHPDNDLCKNITAKYLFSNDATGTLCSFEENKFRKLMYRSRELDNLATTIAHSANVGGEYAAAETDEMRTLRNVEFKHGEASQFTSKWYNSVRDYDIPIRQNMGDTTPPPRNGVQPNQMYVKFNEWYRRVLDTIRTQLIRHCNDAGAGAANLHADLIEEYNFDCDVYAYDPMAPNDKVTILYKDPREVLTNDELGSFGIPLGLRGGIGLMLRLIKHFLTDSADRNFDYYCLFGADIGNLPYTDGYLSVCKPFLVYEPNQPCNFGYGGPSVEIPWEMNAGWSRFVYGNITIRKLNIPHERSKTTDTLGNGRLVDAGWNYTADVVTYQNRMDELTMRLDVVPITKATKLTSDGKISSIPGLETYSDAIDVMDDLEKFMNNVYLSLEIWGNTHGKDTAGQFLPDEEPKNANLWKNQFKSLFTRDKTLPKVLKDSVIQPDAAPWFDIVNDDFSEVGIINALCDNDAFTNNITLINRMVRNAAYNDTVAVSRAIESAPYVDNGVVYHIDDIMKNVYYTCRACTTNSNDNYYVENVLYQYAKTVETLSAIMNGQIEEVDQHGNVELTKLFVPTADGFDVQLKGAYKFRGGTVASKSEVIDFVALLLKYMVYGLVILILVMALVMAYRYYQKRKNMTLKKK